VSEFLAQVCAEAEARVALAVRSEPFEALRARATTLPEPPPFGAALRGGSIIAEVKRASPSRGRIVESCDALERARQFEAGGAAAVSVLTEPEHFRGSLADLQQVAAGVTLPVLRKDFIIDPYQLFEARAAGAAAALLLVGALEHTQLVQLLLTAQEAGVEPLIEIHGTAEVDRAVAALAVVPHNGRPPVIGVNARDLRRLSVDPEVFASTVGAVPDGAIVVAESGVHDPTDVEQYVRLGADAVLVGEYLMRAADPSSATAGLAAAARATAQTEAL
jgi:indole-3-glycerol phosphate synthase